MLSHTLIDPRNWFGIATKFVSRGRTPDERFTKFGDDPLTGAASPCSWTKLWNRCFAIAPLRASVLGGAIRYRQLQANQRQIPLRADIDPRAAVILSETSGPTERREPPNSSQSPQCGTSNDLHQHTGSAGILSRLHRLAALHQKASLRLRPQQ